MRVTERRIKTALARAPICEAWRKRLRGVRSLPGLIRRLRAMPAPDRTAAAQWLFDQGVSAGLRFNFGCAWGPGCDNHRKVSVRAYLAALRPEHLLPLVKQWSCK